ncbi:MAG: 3-hydroxyacyl-CoA dehydrogenase family protein [Candidatus Cloacimonetes bacterium]|nr:3-hydroxyacyl-CoA dehydrogenase family protein [Candidatus Cloacimonadota bacterium]
MSGHVVVIGAGTMGHGIAQVTAMAGYDVALVDTSADLARRGIERITANLDEGVRRGKLDEAQREATLARIRPFTSVAEAAPDAFLAVEAVPERLDLKTAVFAELEHHAAPDTIFASNTSSLSITTLQRATARPEQVVGMHFFNPVHINRLLELVRGRDTSQETMDAAVAFAGRIGKDAIVVNDSPGFATSRLGVLLGLEAIRMVEGGVASPADIDKAMELGYRHPMGPLRLTDLVGLDVRLDIARYLHTELKSDAYRPPALLEQMVAEGRLGKKSGRGFYDWSGS